jgi:hypothetical protein
LSTPPMTFTLAPRLKIYLKNIIWCHEHGGDACVLNKCNSIIDRRPMQQWTVICVEIIDGCDAWIDQMLQSIDRAVLRRLNGIESVGRSWRRFGRL